MSKTPLRVVLDSNVFSVANFATIAASPMRELCLSGRILPIYCGVVIEETLRAYFSPRTREALLTAWLPFILNTASRFCEDLPTIWRRELVHGRGNKASIFMDPVSQRRLILELENIPADGSWDLFGETITEREDDATRLKARRENSKLMREEVSRMAKLAQVGFVPMNRNFKLAPEAELQLMKILGYALIRRFVAPKDWLAVGNRWVRQRDSYPLFSQFVANVIFQEFLVMTDHSSPIDLNAQADLDILTHLIHGDALVTNETGFMRIAFDKIWRPKGKVIFSSVEFSEFLRRL